MALAIDSTWSEHAQLRFLMFEMRKQFRQHPANAAIGTNEIHLARIELATFSVLG